MDSIAPEGLDITEPATSRLLDLFFDQEGSALCLMDSAGKVLRTNMACLGVLGRSSELPDRDTGSGNLDRLRRLVAEAGLKMTVLPVVLGDGVGRLVSVSESRQPAATDERLTALVASEERYRLLFNSMTEAFALHEIVLDDQGEPCDYRFLEVNAAFERATGLARSRAIGTRVKELLPTIDPEWIRVYGKVALTGESVRFDRFEATLGRHYEVFAFCPRPLQFAVLFQDITERKAAEKALRESEELFRSVVTTMSEGVVVLNPAGEVTVCNPAAERAFGLTAQEIRDHTPIRWRAIHEDGSPVEPGELPPLAALRTRAPQSTGIVGFIKPSGGLTWIRGSSEPLLDSNGEFFGVVSTFADVTERRAIREHLTVSSRLASMGTLIAGLAHEMNNPLAGEISGQALAIEIVREVHALLADDRLGERSAVEEKLDELLEILADAQSAAQRIARIVRDLSLFGRPGADRTVVHLGDVVDEAIRRARPKVPPGAEVRVENLDAPDVLATPGHLERVVENLLTNALKAIPTGRSGVVTVRLGAGAQGMARLEVTDNGQGIDPTLTERIFDPFFTTRGVGVGMGLGLPICHAIVTAHGGTLTATSAPGEGSTFRVDLPADAGKVQAATLPP